MQMIWIIARYEYGRHIRRRSFLFTSIGLPLLLAALLGATVLLLIQTSGEERIGVVDLTGRFAQLDVPTADPRPGRPFVPFPSEESARQALSDGAIDAYVVIPPDYMANGMVRAVSPEQLSSLVEQRLRAVLRHGLLEIVPQQDRARLAEPMNLVLRTIDSGREVSADNGLLFFVPYLFALLFVITTFTTSGYLLQAIAEEKEDRVIELLATTVSPTQMMAGKIIGLSAVGLTQMLIWIAFAAFVVGLTTGATWIADAHLSWSLLGLSLLYFLLGYLLIAASYATLGAAVTTPQEAQPLAAPISLLSVAPMVLLMVILAQPNGMIAVVLSLIPFSAPMTMLMRLPLADIPPWQIVVSLVELVLAVVGVMVLAARVMRRGMLRYGRRLSVAEIFSRSG